MRDADQDAKRGDSLGLPKLQLAGRFDIEQMVKNSVLKQLKDWSRWQPFNGCWRGQIIPAKSGLYRVRRAGESKLTYVGQTSNLKSRMGQLAQLYKDAMPYRDPHTAAPILWAIRHKYNCDFEVSVLPVECSSQWLRGLESLTISLYRQETQQSPEANFGRIPQGYQISSMRKKGMAGGLTTTLNSNHGFGVPPCGSLVGQVAALDWCGHEWSAWLSIKYLSQIPQNLKGLYRIRSQEEEVLTYIGQGKIRDRLSAHLKRVQQLDNRQGQIFAAAQPLECSWVSSAEWEDHQRLELENDLIASHLLVTEELPAAQFLG